jgi:uncharacterized protein (DUF433 family)
MQTGDINKWIEVNPSIMMGKPVIKGTRLTVEMILEKFAAGETFENIQESYPAISRQQILAAFYFASQILKGEAIYPLAV